MCLTNWIKKFLWQCDNCLVFMLQIFKCHPDIGNTYYELLIATGHYGLYIGPNDRKIICLSDIDQTSGMRKVQQRWYSHWWIHLHKLLISKKIPYQHHHALLDTDFALDVWLLGMKIYHPQPMKQRKTVQKLSKIHRLHTLRLWKMKFLLPVLEILLK